MYKKRRRFRRRSYFRRRRTYRRRRYSRILAYKRNTPEVKSLSWEFDALPVYEDFQSTGTANLQSGFGALSNLLAGISQGTGSGDRIGNRIFVKSIRFDFVGSACPASTDTTTYIDSFYYRPMVTNAPTVLSTISGYFNIANKLRFNATISRKNLNVYHDRIYKANGASWLNSNSSNNTANHIGNIIHGRFVIPFNRQVEYNTSGGPKNDRDIITLHHIGLSAWSMRQTTAQTRQLSCVNYKVKVYFTDS